VKRLNAETAVGLFVIAGILCLAWLSVKLGKLEVLETGTVPVIAEFTSVSGLKAGAAVEIAGVEVGKVVSITEKEYKALVTMKLRNGIPLQEDAIASIRTRGLIGDKYVSLTPGASDRLIPPGGRIRETEPAVDLEGILGQFIHGSAK
jgi:phospholipid/cholesterol/gamma-HCH transport system substrate-binding protein